MLVVRQKTSFLSVMREKDRWRRDRGCMRPELPDSGSEVLELETFLLSSCICGYWVTGLHLVREKVGLVERVCARMCCSAWKRAKRGDCGGGGGDRERERVGVDTQ